ncbi:MAG TPA: hypothetical protein DCQ06_12675 [Myxococcales bacterium]|nr:hypothetical protein [Myxococcales bacterium]
MDKLPLRTLTVTGSARQLGAGQGEHLRDMIEGFVNLRLDAVPGFFDELGRGSLAELLHVGRQCMGIFRRWDPDAYQEHLAIAAAAGVDPVALFTTGNMTDMRDVVSYDLRHRDPQPADSEGCSMVLTPGSHTVDGAHLVGQTWDLNPGDVEYVVGIHRIPDNAPETWSVTVSGCPSLVGMNEHGICTGTTNIKTWGARVGVGYMNILHRVLAQRSFDRAVEVVTSAPRSGAHTYWLADPSEVSDWETTPDSAIRRDATDGPLWRTNHCLNSSHQRDEGVEVSSSSQLRFDRIGNVLDAGPMDRQRLTALFSDRSDGVDSINRYVEDEQGTATNSALIMIPERRELWACRGPADRGQWQRLEFQRG